MRLTLSAISDPETGVACSVRPDNDRDVLPILTARESECLLWASRGKTMWESSVILGLSEKTIEFHVRNAIKKLNTCNVAHAVAQAIRLHLIE